MLRPTNWRAIGTARFQLATPPTFVSGNELSGEIHAWQPVKPNGSRLTGNGAPFHVELLKPRTPNGRLKGLEGRLVKRIANVPPSRGSEEPTVPIAGVPTGPAQ